MNKILGLLLIFFLLINCSLDNKSKLWKEPKKNKLEKKLVIKELFNEEKVITDELNSNLKINLRSKLSNNFVANLTNNYKRVNYNGDLKIVSKYNFSAINNFSQHELEIVFQGDNLIFFDKKGSILKFDKFSKLIWKKNFYKKSEVKLNPILSLTNNPKTLIVVDNLAKLYAVNIKTGELLWMKNNIAPFNSQIKIFKDKFFVVDFENILRCYSIKDGKELWNIKTETSFIKSYKKLSLVILNEKIYFNNSLGDISAADTNTGDLIWQTPTQNSSVYENAFLLETSDLIIDNNSILFSNNKNEFYSLRADNGILNWKQKINSNLRSTTTDNLIFAITIEGFLIVIESQTGNIIRITNIFDKINPKKISKIKPVGFVVGVKNIYLTTDNGMLIVIDISSGRSSLVLKIGNKKISRPFVMNKNLFIIKNNVIVKLN